MSHALGSTLKMTSGDPHDALTHCCLTNHPKGKGNHFIAFHCSGGWGRGGARARLGSPRSVRLLVTPGCLGLSDGSGAPPVASCLHLASWLQGPLSSHGSSGLQEGRSFCPTECLGLEGPVGPSSHPIGQSSDKSPPPDGRGRIVRRRLCRFAPRPFP